MQLPLPNMKTIGFLLLGLGLLLSPLQAGDMRQQSPEMATLIGRVFLTLSKGFTVSGQDFDAPSLWVNAALGHAPGTMRNGQPGEMRTVMVPTASGIVLHFYGVYGLGAVQKEWSTWNDREKGTFEILVELPGEKFIGIMGFYGQAVPEATIAELMALSTTLPENHPDGKK
jgi:hypothetical protein